MPILTHIKWAEIEEKMSKITHFGGFFTVLAGGGSIFKFSPKLHRGGILGRLQWTPLLLLGIKLKRFNWQMAVLSPAVGLPPMVLRRAASSRWCT